MSLNELGIFTIGAGIALIAVAQVARRRGERLKRAGVTALAASKPKGFAESVRLFFLGPQPRYAKDVVRVVAVGVSVFVVVVCLGLLCLGLLAATRYIR